MDAYMSILRIVHIGGAVLWAGSVLMAALFVMPASKALGPEGGKFMRQLFKTNKYPLVINITAALTVLSGLILYDKVSAHFNPEWIHSGYGMMLTIGSIMALAALIYGSVILRPTAMKLVGLGDTVEAGGAPPTPEQQGEMGKLSGKMTGGMHIMALLLTLSLIFMSVARYTYF